MAEAVYILGTLVSLACAILLWRSYRTTGTRLLLWAGLCFFGLALNNVELLADLYIVPDVSLSILRSVTALGSLALLLYGLLWEVT